MNVRVSTTSNPKYDWCGIDFPEITGVVDFAVVHNGVWRVVGEVKGDSSEGFILLAAMLRTQDIGHMVRSMLLFHDFAIHNMLCRDHG